MKKSIWILFAIVLVVVVGCQRIETVRKSAAIYMEELEKSIPVRDGCEFLNSSTDSWYTRSFADSPQPVAPIVNRSSRWMGWTPDYGDKICMFVEVMAFSDPAVVESEWLYRGGGVYNPIVSGNKITTDYCYNNVGFRLCSATASVKAGDFVVVVETNEFSKELSMQTRDAYVDAIMLELKELYPDYKLK